MTRKQDRPTLKQQMEAVWLDDECRQPLRLAQWLDQPLLYELHPRPCASSNPPN